MFPFTQKKVFQVPKNMRSSNSLADFSRLLAKSFEGEGAIVSRINDDSLFFQAGIFGAGLSSKSGSLNKVTSFDRGYIYLEDCGDILKIKYDVRMYQGFIAASALSVIVFFLGNHLRFGIFICPLLTSIFPFILYVINIAFATRRFEAWMQKIVNE